MNARFTVKAAAGWMHVLLCCGAMDWANLEVCVCVHVRVCALGMNMASCQGGLYLSSRPALQPLHIVSQFMLFTEALCYVSLAVYCFEQQL